MTGPDPRTTDDDDADGAGGIGRRTFLAAAGTAAIGSAMTGTGAANSTTSASSGTTTATTPTYESFEVGADRLVFGGQRVVGADGYPTIQAAVDEAQSGDTVYVHSSYDAEAAGESFPIRLDYSQKEVALAGGHPSGSVIDASHTNADVVEVVGVGHQDYGNNPVVRDLRIVGGNVGLKIYGAPFSSYRDLVFDRTGSHGVEVCEYTDGDGNEYGTFGTTFTNCQAWNCGGNGFHLNAGAAPHSTTFAHCKATACRGIGFRLRGTSVSLFGGDAQLNFGWGIESRGGFNTLVEGVYVEGNARGAEHDAAPSEMYVRGTDGFTVRNCYFHGIYPRGAEHGFDRVQRGITAHDSEGVTVQNCTVRRYGRGFLALYGGTDADVHRPSHVVRETQLFGGGTGTRTRSDGVVVPQDLTAVDGAFDGDRGYHVGTDSEGFAVWRNGQWNLAETTAL